MRCISQAIMGQEAGDVAIIETFDPFSWEIESCPNQQLKAGEACVFSIPFGFLVICLLVFSNLVSKSSQLLTKSVFHLTVGHFAGSDSFEESVTDFPQGDSIDIITNGIEGCGDHAG
jgi:hypothetical protein